MQFLSHHIGIDISQTYSFGDSYNDLELIRQAGVGIAVSNKIDELKTTANEVTLSNRENGPAKYLQQFFLKKIVLLWYNKKAREFSKGEN